MPKDAVNKSCHTETCSAQQFWDEHVCKREPKLFEKIPVTKEWNTAAWVKDFPEYFKKQAVSLFLTDMGDDAALHSLLPHALTFYRAA